MMAIKQFRESVGQTQEEFALFKALVQNLRVLRQANLEALINPEALVSRVVERRALYYITSEKKQDFCRRWVNAIYYSSGYER